MLNLSGADCRLTNSRPRFFYLRRILEMFHSNKSKLHTRTDFAVLRVRELFQFPLQPPPVFISASQLHSKWIDERTRRVRLPRRNLQKQMEPAPRQALPKTPSFRKKLCPTSIMFTFSWMKQPDHIFTLVVPKI